MIPPAQTTEDLEEEQSCHADEKENPPRDPREQGGKNRQNLRSDSPWVVVGGKTTVTTPPPPVTVDVAAATTITTFFDVSILGRNNLLGCVCAGMVAVAVHD